MTFVPFAAYNAKVRLGGPTATSGPSGPVGTGGLGPYVFTAKKWDVKAATGPADTTSFEDEGFENEIGTTIGAEYTISDSDWDSNANPYDNPPNLRPRQNISAQLFTSDLGSPFWFFPNSLVRSVDNSADVKAAMKIPGVHCKGKGRFYFPTGVITPPSL